MKNLNRLNNFSFAAITGILLVTAGLIIGVSIPSLQNWQHKNIDRIISQANSSNNQSTKLALLSQAALLGKNDPLATYTYANALWQAGEYQKSIDAYTDSWLAPNYNYLGELALKSGNSMQAKGFFSKANSKGENDESLVGLAIVEFDNGNTQKGCEYAEKSIKLNLSSAKAEQALAICKIKQGKSDLDNRAQIYTMLNAYMYKDALDGLQKLAIKNTSDWLAISSIYANTGKLNSAIDALKSGLDQNPADKVLMQRLVQLLKLQNRGEDAQIYEARLQELEFKNFPNK